MTAVNTDKFIGIPFAAGQSGFEGCDCWGLVRLVYRDLWQIELPSFVISCSDSSKVNAAFAEQTVHGPWVLLDTPEFPCVVAVATVPEHPKLVSHFGVFIGGGRVLHTFEGRGAHLLRLSDRFFRSRVKGFYRYVG